MQDRLSSGRVRLNYNVFAADMDAGTLASPGLRILSQPAHQLAHGGIAKSCRPLAQHLDAASVSGAVLNQDL